MKLGLAAPRLLAVVALGGPYSCRAWRTAAFQSIGMGRVRRSRPSTAATKSLHLSSSSSSSSSSAETAPSSSSDFNVVLRPSSDPRAFDSHRIGTARVHRYLRESSDETEYVMWYHGREETFDPDGVLPPLSTGRIGRATSRNGLHWERTVEGSLSEDVSGVSLGLNKESWWSFDTAHVGLGQVMLPMTTPAVVAEGGVYIMYYMGGSFEETPIGDYLDGDLPSGAEGAKIKGMKMKIGVAISQDGLSWGRVEGDDPTGACMTPYDLSDPNMKHVASLRDDDDTLLDIEEELYCGWPEVAVRQAKKAGSEEDGFFMYYSTMTKADKVKSIACAVSPDGFRWTKRGVCLRPDETGPDAGGCARCNVLGKAAFDENTGRWTENADGGWIMFYEGISKEDGKHRVMSAETADGREWHKTGMVLDVGGEGTWDCDGVGSPHVLRLDDGTMRMYYTGQGEDGSTAIGVAKFTPSSGEWMREQAQFTFA